MRAGEGLAPVVKRLHKRSGGDGGGYKRLRQEADAEAVQRGLQAGPDRVEDDLALDLGPDRLAVLLELPGIERAAGDETQVDAFMSRCLEYLQDTL